MSKPYTYVLGWTRQDKWYYGVRYANNCDPMDLWVSYHSSSVHVQLMREEFGDPDYIEIRRLFKTATQAKRCESKVQRKLNLRDNSRWLNKHNQGEKFAHTGEHSAETKAKISNSTKGCKKTPEHKQKISKTLKGKTSPAKAAQSRKALAKATAINTGKKRPEHAAKMKIKMVEVHAKRKTQNV